MRFYPPLVQEFATYKRSIQGCSQKTVNEYLLDLRTFFRYCVLKKSGEDLTDENMEKEDITKLDLLFFESVSTTDIYEFLYYLSEEKNSVNTTKARKLSAIKAFYKYLTVKRHLTEINPALNIESPKLKRALPKYLSEDESIRLLNAINSDEESKNRERDYAIVTLFLNCGMRVSELAGISVQDLDDSLRSLRVLGKGSKERIIYLNDACRDALMSYIRIRAVSPTKNKNEHALFVSRLGVRMSVKTIQHVVYKYLALAGLEYKHYSAHKLRHTAATLMYQSGQVDIRVLKDILGHEQLTTTQIYTHVSNAHMEEAMSKNPLSHGPRLKKRNLSKPLNKKKVDTDKNEAKE